jgi:fluoride ion exporter CrcB/FEX
MGAFTTFSSYVSETLHLTAGGQLSRAAINLVAQNALGFAALAGGIGLGRQV